MVRLIGFLAGAAFCFVLLVAAIQPRDAQTETPHGLEPIKTHWSFNGPNGMGVLGKYDRAQLQRGFQVYKEICSSCHSMHLVAFRDLTAIGFSEPEVKAIAKNWNYKVPTINDDGTPGERAPLPADRIPGPFANEKAARAANNNALPPDFSLIAKAREGGPDYIHSLVAKGYDESARPKGWETPEGLYFNKYFPNLNIAMPPPLVQDGQVTYNDGTKATVDQMGKDVSAFLMWASEPRLEERRSTGLAVVMFLSVLAVFAWATYRKVWAPLKKGYKSAGLAQPAE
ncbi:MAG: cytochrome c1 [Sphingomonadaceae bacterium]|nr:cytochrome c1 [Sphingomonadaceae bacterium]